MRLIVGMPPKFWARHGAISLLSLALASCVAPREQAPAPRPAPPALPPLALPAAPPQKDWRDIPLTPGTWTWRGGAGQASLAQYGEPGQAALFALRCDLASRTVGFSRAGMLSAGGTTMQFTTSFTSFAVSAANGGGTPPAITARLGARDPHLDQLAFSRGRFLVNVAGQAQLVLPSWPEVARVIEDCRG